MPRIKNSKPTDQLPKAAPKRVPKAKPKAAPEIVPDLEPKQAPKVTPIRRSIRRPVVTPEIVSENTVYFVYDLPYYNTPGHPGYKKCHPKFFGECFGEYITERDAKTSLRRNEQYGAFAIAERINGQIGPSYPIEIEEPEEIEIGDDLDSEDGTPVFDDHEIDEIPGLNSMQRELLRQKTRAIKAEMEAKALREARNGSHGLSEFTETLKFVREVAAPPQKPIEILRELKEASEFFNSPRRESNPAPAPQPQRSEEEVLISAVARNPEIADKLTTGLFRKFLGGESFKEGPTWEDVMFKAVENGEASKIAGAFLNMFTTALGNLLPKPAQAPAPAQTVQQAPQQPQQPAPQAAPTQALPDAQQQQPQATQPQSEQPPQMTAADQLILGLIELMRRNASMAETRQLINLWEYRAPELSENIDMLVEWPIDQTLSVLSAYHPEVSTIPHAREWLQSLINSLTAEETGEFKETEL